MNKQEILEFLNKYPACNIATVEGNKPHTRGMLIYRADEKGIVFHTGNSKDIFKQLQVNPNIELCFNNFDQSNSIQIRVSGVAGLDNDTKLKDEIIASRPFLKPIVEKFGRDVLAVFRVEKLSATVWTMPTNMAPKVYINL